MAYYNSPFYSIIKMKLRRQPNFQPSKFSVNAIWPTQSGCILNMMPRQAWRLHHRTFQVVGDRDFYIAFGKKGTWPFLHIFQWFLLGQARRTTIPFKIHIHLSVGASTSCPTPSLSISLFLTSLMQKYVLCGIAANLRGLL